MTTNICRVCLSTGDGSVYIPLSALIKSLTVADLINLCASTDIKIDDNYPQSVCVSCFKNLNISYEFKTLCESSQPKLIKFHNENGKISNHRVTNLPMLKINNKVLENNQITIDNDVVKNVILISKLYVDEVKKEKYVKVLQSNKKIYFPINNITTSSPSKDKETILSSLQGNKEISLKNLKQISEQTTSQPILIVNYESRFLIEEYPFKDLIKITDNSQGINEHVPNVQEGQPNSFPNEQLVLYNSLSSHSSDANFEDFTEDKEENFKCDDDGEGGILNDDLKHTQVGRKFQGKKSKSMTKSMKDVKSDSVCHICGRILRTEGLPRHIKYYHEGIKKKIHPLVTCDICQKTFKHKSGLADHMNQHTGIKKYVCALCGMSYAQITGYRQHLKAHPEISRYKCILCSKVFRTPGLFSDHMNIHNGHRIYSCEICQGKFCTKGNLRKHLKIHKERRNKCDICNKLFQEPFALRRHMLVHTGVKAFQCDVCAANFAQKSDMRRHIMRHFQNENTNDGTTQSAVKATSQHTTTNSEYIWLTV